MIRKAVIGDFGRLMEIFDAARGIMRANGNPTQWPVGTPSAESVKKDIEDGVMYVISSGETPNGCFLFREGPEPTYRDVDGGKEYFVIHRVASDGTSAGVMKEILSYAFSNAERVMIDTHRDNRIMRHILAKNGFSEVGTVIIDDGTERIAFVKER